MPSISREEATAKLRLLCVDLRVQIIEMLAAAGSGHPGGSLSAIDLISTLFEYKLRHDVAQPDWADRDRFVLSKGHCVPALYAVLAHRGFIDAAQLKTLRQVGSRLQGHPVVETVPTIEACTGSLGQGLSVAHGIALGARLDGKRYTVYCMLGDGEIQEGQVWEAAMSAGKFGVDNLVAILDYNKVQTGRVSEVMPLEPLEDKWRAFGWLVRSIDGHDYGEILDAYDWTDAREGKPKLIIAHTVKGKGVSFMEDDPEWHGKAPNDEQAAQAIEEIRAGARS